MSVDGSTALVGAGACDRQGRAFVFVRTTSGWREAAELSPKLLTGVEGFGAHVALSANGRVALVGAPGTDQTHGAAFVFVRAGDVWTEQDVLTGRGEVGEGAFGSSVAISADGAVAAIGADSDRTFHPRPKIGAPPGYGAVWFFTRHGSEWEQDGSKLTVPDTPGGTFGYCAALSGDGRTALVGAPYNSYTGSASHPTGAAWILTDTAHGWRVTARLRPHGGGGLMEYGCWDALSANGATVFVGAPNDRNAAGAVWVYTRTGSTWQQQTILTPAHQTQMDGFGAAIAMSGSGDTLTIGGIDTNSHRGAIWRFTRDGRAWRQIGAALAPDALPRSAYFGFSVGTSANGDTLIVGAPGYNDNRGAAWIFTVT